ncbi:MAG: hypothetical protein ACYTG7_13685 [Planctomycetota bacterium]|jgi:hypothetical protein
MMESKSARLWILFVVLVFALPMGVFAQEPSAEQKKFWDSFQKSFQAGDPEKTLKFVRRNRGPAPDAFEFYFIDYAMNGAEKVDIEALKALTGHLTIALKNSYSAYKLHHYLNLPEASQESWGRAYDTYVRGFLAYTEATENDNPYKMDEAQSSFEQALKIFEYLEDKLAVADVHIRLAEVTISFEDDYESCVHYHKAMEAYNSLPERLDEMSILPPNKELVQEKLQEYLDKGYDPTKPRLEGGEPDLTAAATEDETVVVEEEGFKKAKFTLVAEDSSVEWPMKYGGMKSPDEFITPAYETGFNPLLWTKFWFDSTQAEEGQQFVPFFATEYYFYGFYGKQLNLTCVKNKFYLDIDGNKRTRMPLKASTKPTKLTIRDVEKGADGKPRQYQFFFQAQGQQEVMFGMEQNNGA